MDDHPLTIVRAARLLGVALCLVGLGWFLVQAGHLAYVNYAHPFPTDEPSEPPLHNAVFLIMPNLWVAAPWLLAGALLTALSKPLGRWLR